MHLAISDNLDGSASECRDRSADALRGPARQLVSSTIDSLYQWIRGDYTRSEVQLKSPGP